jgi:glycosyltransferase involved in cell wall biosynthesis
MRIGYFVRDLLVRDPSGRLAQCGGIKVVLQHVTMLKRAGYEVVLMARNIPLDLNPAERGLYENPVVLASDTLDGIPACDVYVGTVFSDVATLFRRTRGKIVHLCQGYEPIDFESRLQGEMVTERYVRSGAFSRLRTYMDGRKFKRRIEKIESAYALPTVKAAVSKHLKDLIERRYQQPCFLIQNGIDPGIFYPDPGRTWGENGQIKVLSVGSTNVGFKGIPDTLEAIKRVKEKGIDLHLIRVSPQTPSQQEKGGRLVDAYYTNVPEEEMAALYRRTDLFISSSLEGEGFGLPAMEALASGVPSILTDISSYRNFGQGDDFAYFVPTRRPDRIADGVVALIRDGALRQRCVEAGKRVAEDFTLKRTEQDLLRFAEALA